MGKFLVIFFLISSLTYTAQDSIHERFQKAYYSGQYGTAHDLLNGAIFDRLERQVWEERIHHQENILGCDHSSQGKSIHALALLRIGEISGATESFEDEDWLSLLCQAVLSRWRNDLQSSRRYIQRALNVNPDEPDLWLAAGDFAASDEEAFKYFSQYLNLAQNASHASSVKSTMEFMRRTREMELNSCASSFAAEELESDYKRGRRVITAVVDRKNKLTLLLDTGAAGLSLAQNDLSPKYISNLAMVGLGENQVTNGKLAVFDHFSTGNFEMKNPVAVVNPSFRGNGIDGVAGSILFSQYSLLVPMRSGIPLMLFSQDVDPIQYLEKRGYSFREKAVLPFFKVNKMIVLKGRIKKSNEEMDLLLDTGAQQSILSTATARKYVRIDYNRTWNRRHYSHLSGLGGRINDFLYTNDVEVKIGPVKKGFKWMIAANLGQLSESLQLELDMILGQDFLKGYTLLIDYHHNNITFLK